jgi:hypothetical protein
LLVSAEVNNTKNIWRTLKQAGGVSNVIILVLLLTAVELSFGGSTDKTGTKTYT